MQIFGFNHGKCKTQCRLGVGRIKLLRNKKQIAMKTLRKEVSELLRQNKQGNARIRVEAVMREHRMLRAYDILELYLELMAVRAELLAKTREVPPDMVEAVCSLIYAGERVSTDLAEIAAVAKMLVSKYSAVYKASGFPDEVVSDLTCRKWQVNDDLVTCLAVAAPLPEEKLAFLEDIATEYGVEFDRDAAALDMLPAAGKPLSIVPYAVEPLPPGGTGVPARGQLPLAHGWQPPAAAPPPPPEAQPPAGWRPPGAGDTAAGAAAGGAAGSAAAAHVTRVLSGGSVVVRHGPGGSPPNKDAWSPPQPEDFNKHGRAFQNHVGATAAWRQTRLHGASPSASPEPSQDLSTASGAAYPPPATGAPPQQPAGGPQAGEGSGDSSPTRSDKLVTPVGSYADASAAAEAAKRYSQMAQAAARRAEEFAAGQSKHGDGASPPGSPGEGDDSGDAGSSAGGSGGLGGAPVFVPRSFSEIQRAYDAAPDPPSKKDAAAPGPPSAPPAATDGASSVDGAPDDDVDISGLPSVPGSSTAPAPATDELDELTKRFEMLKKR